MVEDRVDVLFSIFNETLQEENLPIVTKVAMKTLRSPVENSLELVEKIYDRTATIEKPSIRLALYQVIIDFSRGHGIMPYIAKGLLQSYLIERDDFTRLRLTYTSGKAILFFEEFLTSEERGLMYCKLSVHAYNLCLFKESVEMAKKAFDETIHDTRMRASTFVALSNSYYRLGNYEQTKEYFSQYKEFSFPEVKDRAKLIEANLHSLSGDYQLAISVLQENLTQYGDDSLLHAVNQLITLYLLTKNLSPIKELIQLEEKLLSITYVTPFKKAELALYSKLKGDYYILTERVEEGIDLYLEAAAGYVKVDLISKESECFRIIKGTKAISRLRDPSSTFLKNSFTLNLISPLKNVNTFFKDTNQHQESLNGHTEDLIYLGHDTYFHTRELWVQEENSKRNLSNREYELLNLFIKNEGEIITKIQIISLIWNDAADEGSVSVLITRLRKKLGRAAKTIHGRKQGGYIFKRI
ncbi:winged helix-turn-helix domain-containing protein [Chengkuizengella sediminis]|uniref:winged helix-turn-helix domain-containing protein n=1 Tax=Chengkuizengella sediminis TaxID=1885917 RepID=UPI00138A1E1E|nr:winged helix-turn-helix domain-containing protein [Chengkuizengella sediminis]NDI36447.1 winged helix-turn-helix transcriptional regulator [Chengkuizengella sediminis]